MLQLKHLKEMWCNGCKLCIKKLDEKKKTYDLGIIVVFHVTNVSSRSDKNLKVSKNIYYGYLEDILQCGYKSFKLVVFEVKWYRFQMNAHDLERTVIEHANGFTMVKTMILETTKEPYVLPR